MRARLATLLLLAAVHAVAGPPSGQPPDGRVDAVVDLVESKYLEKVDRATLVSQALRAFLKDLDPYSSYLDPEEWALYDSGFDESFGGVGATLHYPPGSRHPVVGLLLIGSAAADAGVRRGDTIVAVDGRDLAGLSFDDVLSLLRGKAGSEVELTITRAAVDAPIVLKMQRRIVKTPTVRGIRRDASGSSEYMLDNAARLGYVRITMLGRETKAELEQAIGSLERRGLRGLVLDLRDSPGGMMTAAASIADLFLEDGVIVTSVTRDARKVIKAGPGVVTDVPLVVLINDRTASSAEILTAALGDNGRAALAGQRTYGKGRIQEKIALGNGRGGVVLTTGTFERPSGRTFDRHDAGDGAKAGIAPGADLELIIEGEELEAWRRDIERLDGAYILTPAEQQPSGEDRVLSRAITFLRERIVESGPPGR